MQSIKLPVRVSLVGFVLTLTSCRKPEAASLHPALPEPFAIEHRVHPRAICFSADGKHLVLGGIDSTGLLYDLDSKGRSILASGKRDGSQDIAYSPDGKHLLDVAWQGGFVLWAAESRDKLFDWTDEKQRTACKWEGDGRHFWIATYNDGELERWSVPEGSPPTNVASIDCPVKGEILGRSFSENADRLALATQQGRLVLVRRDGEQWSIEADVVSSNRFSNITALNEQKSVLAATRDGRVLRLSAGATELKDVGTWAVASVQVLVAAPNEHLCFLGGYTSVENISTAIVFDARTGQTRWRTQFRGLLMAARFSADSQKLSFVYTTDRPNDEPQSTINVIDLNSVAVEQHGG